MNACDELVLGIEVAEVAFGCSRGDIGLLGGGDEVFGGEVVGECVEDGELGGVDGL